MECFPNEHLHGGLKYLCAFVILETRVAGTQGGAENQHYSMDKLSTRYTKGEGSDKLQTKDPGMFKVHSLPGVSAMQLSFCSVGLKQCLPPDRLWV